MDTIITNLNSAGQAFVNFSLPMLIQVGILIVILLGLDWLLRKRVKAVIRYGIWMLVLVKLVLPPSLTSPTGIGYWIGDKLPEMPSVKPSETDSSAAITFQPATNEFSQPVTNLDSPTIEASPILEKPSTPVVSKSPAVPIDTNPTLHEQVITKTETETTPATTTTPVTPSTSIETTTPITSQAIIFLVWLGIVFSLVLLLLQRVFFVRTLIAQSETASGKIMDILERCRNQMNIKQKIILKLSPNTTSPSVCGLFRPVILFPRNLMDRLDSQQLQSVFLHELAHIKRGDLWISMLQTVLQILYFYNPLFWLANWKIRRLREQAVDETVLAALGEKAEQYPNTLLDVSKQVFARPALSLRLVGVVESKAALKNRIRHIVTRPFPQSARVGIVGITLIFLTALILLPMAKAEKHVTDETTLIVSSTDAEKKNIKLLIPKLTAHKYYQIGEPINIQIKSVASNWKPAWIDIYSDDDIKPFFILLNGKEYLASLEVGPFDGWTQWPELQYIPHKTIKFPAGKYRFAYGWKNLDVVNPDKPDKPVHFDRLITNEVEFEVVDKVPDGYYRPVYENGWEDIFRDKTIFTFTDDWQSSGVAGTLLGLKIQTLPFDIAFDLYGQAEGSNEWESAGRLAIKADPVNTTHIHGIKVKGLTWDNVGDRRWRLMLKPSREAAISHPPIHEYYGREFVTDWLTFKRSDWFDVHRQLIEKHEKRKQKPSRGGNIKSDKPVDLDRLVRREKGDVEKTWPLPNGVTVELLGVFKGITRDQRTWWRPDGESVSQAKIEQYEKKGYVDRAVQMPMSKNDRFVYGYLVRYEPADDITVSSDVTEGTQWHHPHPFADGLCANTVTVRTGDLPIGQQGEIRVKAAFGTWKRVAFDIRSENSFDDIHPISNQSNIMISGVREKGSKKYLNVIENDGNLDIRVFYEYKNRNVRKASRQGTLGTSNLIRPNLGKSLKQHRFTIDPVGVKKVIVEYRQFEYVTFKNVSLKPGHKTHVTIRGKAYPITEDIDLNNSIGSVNLPVGTKGTVTTKHGDAIYGSDTKYSSLMYLGRVGQGQKIALLDNKVYYNEFSRPIVKVKAISTLYATVPVGTIGWISLAGTDFTKAFEQKRDEQLPQHFKEKKKESFARTLQYLSGKSSPEELKKLRAQYSHRLKSISPTDPNLNADVQRKDLENIQPLIDSDPKILKLNQQVEQLESEIKECIEKKTMKTTHPTLQILLLKLGSIQKQLDQRKLLILQIYLEGPKASNVRVDLPNDITLEYLGFGNITDDKLQWWDTNGQPTHIRGVSEADVEGLGTVLVFKIITAKQLDRIGLCAEKWQGPYNTSLNKCWFIPDSNIGLACLEAETRFINLRLYFDGDAPWMKSDVIPLPIDQLRKGQPVKINTHGIETIHLDSELSDALCLSVTMKHEGRTTSTQYRNFFALDTSQKKYRGDIYTKGNIDRNVNRIPYIFNIPPDDLAGVKFEYRYHYSSAVDFEDMTLMPGKNANPKIEIIDEDE